VPGFFAGYTFRESGLTTFAKTGGHPQVSRLRIGAQRGLEMPSRPGGGFELPHDPCKSLDFLSGFGYKLLMTHAKLVEAAIAWLRRYRCGIVLSEQGCASGEMPDAIGWKGKCHSVLVECKLSRADFLTDREKQWRTDAEIALGCERYYVAPRGLLRVEELPDGWGLLEMHAREMVVSRKSKKNLRRPGGFMNEMNLLLASLRRVEIRIEPQTITDFLKWKNRLAEYNGGAMPEGVLAPEQEKNPHLM
jgi:hypothetical protein